MQQAYTRVPAAWVWLIARFGDESRARRPVATSAPNVDAMRMRSRGAVKIARAELWGYGINANLSTSEINV